MFDDEIPTSSARAVELIDPTKFWILGSGKANVFVVERKGEGDVLRRSVMECEAPSCFIALNDPILHLVIQCGPDTELDPAPLNKLPSVPSHMRMVLREFEGMLASLNAGSALAELRGLPLPNTMEAIEALRTKMRGWMLSAWDVQTADEIERMVNKLLDAEDVIKVAARKLSSVLTGGRSDIAAGGGNSLIRAIRIVARAAGIAAIDHPSSETLPSMELRVQSIARASRCRARQVELEGAWWKGDNGPLLGFDRETIAPAALIRRRKGYVLHDPEKQTQRIVDAEVAATLSPLGYTFYRPFPNKPIDWRELVKFASRGMGGDVLWLLVMGVAIGLMGVLTPLATQAIFDHVIPGAERVQLAQLTMGLLAASFSVALFTLVQGYAFLRLEIRAAREVQSAVMDRLLKLPAPFFRKFSVGDLATRVMAVDAIREVISGIGIVAFLGVLSASFNFLILFHHGWQLGVLAAVLTAIAIGTATILNFWALRYTREVENLEGKISGMVNQFIAGISKLRIAGAEGHAFAVWADSFSEKKRFKVRARLIQNWLTIFNTVFAPLATLAIFVLVAVVLTGGSGISTGAFLAFSAAFGSFTAAAIALSNTTMNLAVAIPLYERAKPILIEPTETMQAKAAPGELTGNIDVQHVTFRYQADGPAVLQDVSVRARPGEFIAIVGASGSGKSTLLRLLLGFERPENGAIYLDGQSLESLDLTEVRRQIGVVLQSSRLLPGDIYTNIASNSGANQEQAWEAAELAGIASDIRAMPMGMQTVITEGGGGFSGGQRQRLMIARALVGKPRLLFFDEATSALDNETQAQVSESLDQLRAARVVIAHRLSTIEKADRIYVMHAGKVVEEGTYEELMNRNGVFKKLARRQIV